jgi:hypothetical protein
LPAGVAHSTTSRRPACHSGRANSASVSNEAGRERVDADGRRQRLGGGLGHPWTMR